MEKEFFELFSHATKAANKLNYDISFEEFANVYKYCLRKLDVIKKSRDYFPILFKSEIDMYIQGRIVNRLGRINKIEKGERVCAANV